MGTLGSQERQSGMNAADGATVIGRSMKLRGDLSGTNDLLIDGEVEGSVRVDGGRVTVGAEGRVRADIVAQDVTISGKVHGDIHAAGAVHLASTAMLLGNIFALRFSMDENAVMRGHVDSPSAHSDAPAEHAEQATHIAQAPAEAAHSGPETAAHDAHGAHLNQQQSERPVGSFPAALAVVAGRFEDGTAAASETAAAESNVPSDDSPELAETQA